MPVLNSTRSQHPAFPAQWYYQLKARSPETGLWPEGGCNKAPDLSN
jgi:hypothetical protein